MIAIFRTTELPPHLREPEETIGHGEHPIVAYLRRVIFADQKRRGFPTVRKLGEALDDTIASPFLRANLCGHHVRKESTTTMPGLTAVTCFDDFLQHRVQILIQHHLAQVNKATPCPTWIGRRKNVVADSAASYGGFTEDGEIERGFLRRGIGETI